MKVEVLLAGRTDGRTDVMCVCVCVCGRVAAAGKELSEHEAAGQT